MDGSRVEQGGGNGLAGENIGDLRSASFAARGEWFPTIVESDLGCIEPPPTARCTATPGELGGLIEHHRNTGTVDDLTFRIARFEPERCDKPG